MAAEDKKETKPEMEVDTKPAGEDATKEEEKVEEKAEPEKPKELEEDAPADKRKKVAAGAVKFSDADATINLLSAADGALLSSIGEGGCQYLLAGARATAGVKAGRYMFEVRVAETKDYFQPAGASRPPLHPSQLLRVGFSLAGSSLFLGDSEDGICFDSEGNLQHGKMRQRVAPQKSNLTMGVLLNLDSASPNKNTISLFRGGKRVCAPQPLPEELVGKTLIPTVAFRNMTVEVNMGPTAHCPLPFKCTMIGAAAQADVEVQKSAASEKGEVLMPVGLSEQGLFSWIDSFLAKNPDYTELSDRKIIEWAQKSGIWKPKHGGSNDKPNMSFGLPLMDDGSVRRMLLSMAPVLKRKYIIGELKANLVPEERKALLAKFAGRPFKTVAAVIMGEPDDEYKKGVQANMLAEKKAKAEAEKKRKAQEAERKKAAAERAKAAKLAAQKKKGETPAEEEEKEKEETPVAMEEESAPVELTEEEKKTVHRKGALQDLSEKVLAKSFGKFSIPTKEEGFDEIKFLWQPQEKCEKVLTDYKYEMKMTQKVEDLKPSAWFKEQMAAWNKELSQWRKLQNEWKNPAAKKKLLAKKEEERKAKAKEEGKEAPEPMKIDVDDLDVFAVDDITDVGTGEPIFSNFAAEDWALLSARYEAFLLTLAFKKDVDDPDRPSFPQSHYAFYYSKYFGKQFYANNFSCKTFADFVKLIKDTLSIDDTSEFVKVLLPEETPLSKFVKLVENHRRDRQRRADAGDESAILKFSGAANGGNSGGGAIGAKRTWPQSGGHQPAWKQQRTNYQGGYNRR
eukprot:TRINITY_DN9457_c0_g2_i3.p1 TRINITY_DN9457_c0_g2~~TRINITY_DN9457_c0_g2_i3.p1  ORF type:complete len:794 (-),score=272.30 TRINITY_DN9457_c0_g2_i3:173-2554(-)